MKRLLRLALLLLLAAPLTACEELATAVDTLAQPATLVVANQTSTPVYFLYISSCSSTSWGPDRLGSDVIAPGATYRWTMDPGCYHVRAEFSDDRWAEGELSLSAGTNFTWRLTN